MRYIDLDAFLRTPLVRSPFEHLVVPDMLRAEKRAALAADFPDSPHPGLLPPGEVAGGPAFRALLDEIRAPELTEAFSEKFALDLGGRPIMITVRARCDASDGRIHTDSTSKLVTALLYLNPGWNEKSGRLRLLRGPDDIDDYVAEVSPEFGTLVAFRRGERSFHGHLPFEGPRRYVMFNWMANDVVARTETARHVLSAKVKRLLRPLRAGAAR